MSPSLLLLPLAWIYDGVTRLRNALFDFGILKQRSFDIPLISVGNLAVGGTGKTPHVEHLLHLLIDQGYRVGMLSRGYGRRTRGYVDGDEHDAAKIGDEPYQIKEKIPYAHIAVCENRCAGLDKMLSYSNRPLDVVVLDDAFQHRYVKPGLSILLTDYARPFDKDLLLPSGRLRESNKGAKRADVIVVTKCPESISREEKEGLHRRLSQNNTKPVFFSHMVYERLREYSVSSVLLVRTTNHNAPISDMKSLKVLLLCGIAKPQPFYDYFAKQCAHVEMAAFPDHHNFTEEELESLGQRAEHFDAVITTEKDAARLRGYTLPPQLLDRLIIQPISLKFQDIEGNENSFNKIITDYVTSH